MREPWLTGLSNICSISLRAHGDRPRLCRAPLLVELQLPRRVLAPGGAGRARAAAGLRGIALTDRDGLYGSVRFTKAAEPQPSFAALCGAELTLESAESEPIRASRPGPDGQGSADRHAAPRAAGREPARLRQPVAADLDRPAARPQARRAPAAGRLRRPHRRPDRALRRAQRPGREGAAAARHRRRGRARRALARSLPRPLLSRTAAPRTARGPGAAARAWCTSRSGWTCRTSRPTASRTPRARTRSSATC